MAGTMSHHPLVFLSLGITLCTVGLAAQNAEGRDQQSLAATGNTVHQTNQAGDDIPSFEMENPVDRLVQDDDETKSKPGILRWAEYRYGQRLGGSALNAQSHMNELRAQLAYQTGGDKLFSTRVDILLDEALHEEKLDVRELKLYIRLSDDLSFTAGRQTVTWLMGDILPVNDFFPKDFNSYFMGRDAEGEYMKLPSDALQFNLTTDIGQFDLVYAPSFTSNVYPEGERFSYFSPLTQSVEGETKPMPHRVADKAFDNDAWYARYSRQFGTNEVFLFVYDGYWMESNSIDTVDNEFYHAPLRSLGFAWRGPSLGGLTTLETAYYHSPDDPKGTDPFIPNDQIRGLIRHDRELGKNFNVTAQYYIEHRIKQGAYESHLPRNVTSLAENYQQYTLRLTKTFLKQVLSLSGFVYYSPTEDDSYFRFNGHYKPDDHWQYHLGVNIFEGEKDSTRWGQYQDNSNVFAGIRYNW